MRRAGSARRASVGRPALARASACTPRSAGRSPARRRRRRRSGRTARRRAPGNARRSATSASPASTAANANAMDAATSAAVARIPARLDRRERLSPRRRGCRRRHAARSTARASAAPAGRTSDRVPRCCRRRRLQVVGHRQRRNVDVLAEKAVAEQPHRVLELDVAPRRHDDVLVPRTGDHLERRQRHRPRLELIQRRHHLDARRSR